MFAGYRPEEANMAVKPPLHPASTFVFPDARTGAAHMETAYGLEGAETPPDGFIYSRLGNPTVTVAEQKTRRVGQQRGCGVVWQRHVRHFHSASGVVWRGPPGLVCGALYGGTHHFWMRCASMGERWQKWTI